MIGFIYKIGIALYETILPLIALFRKDARLLVNGRKESAASLERWERGDDASLVWIHVASKGEYEQVKPLISLIKEWQPQRKMALTFYSPSGYNTTWDKEVDWQGYFPGDKPSKVKVFLDRMRPDMAIFCKNEWWWNTLGILEKRSIPIHYVSSTVREDHYFIKSPLSFFQNTLNAVISYGVVDQKSLETMTAKYPSLNVYRSGDMRVARVTDLSKNSEKTGLSEVLQGKMVIIYGSVWQSDLPVMRKLIEKYPESTHVVFPHMLDESSINIFEKELSNHDNILIIKEAGKLAQSYRYGQLAYIGGGYGDGVHNVLEAAIYKIPVVTGPRNRKSSEAQELKKLGCLYDEGIDGSFEDFINSFETNKQKLDTFLDRHINATIVTYNHIFGDQ